MQHRRSFLCLQIRPLQNVVSSRLRLLQGASEKYRGWEASSNLGNINTGIDRHNEEIPEEAYSLLRGVCELLSFIHWLTSLVSCNLDHLLSFLVHLIPCN